MPSFDELYQVHKHPWGSKPTSEIAEYVREFKPGSILDIGVGDGRNALFLAEQGFHLTGLDISAEAIAILQERAKEMGVEASVEGIVADIGEYTLKKEYDNIISNFTLHFLPKERFLPVLRMLQAHTAEGGMHLISDFTQDGPLYKPTTSKYWLKSGELPTFYEGWSVLYHEEKPTQTRATDEAGNHYTQVAVTLVARKG